MKKLIAIISVVLMLLTSISIAFAEDATTTETDTTTDVATESTATTDVEAVVSAETGEGDVSVAPDNPLWGVKRAIERIDLALTFNKAAKSEKGLKYARIRLLEVQKMMKKGDLKNAARAQKVHAELVAKVSEDIDEAEERDGETEKVKEIRDNLRNNIAALEAVKAKLEAKGVPTQGIENALARTRLMQECRDKIRVLAKSAESKDDIIKVRTECQEKLKTLMKERKEIVAQEEENGKKIAARRKLEEVKKISPKMEKNKFSEPETEDESEVEETETTESTEIATEASETETSSEPTTA